MSLIHEALKKLESMRQASHVAGPVASGGALSPRQRPLKILRPLLALMVISALGFAALKILPQRLQRSAGIDKTAPLHTAPSNGHAEPAADMAAQVAANDPAAEKNANGMRLFSALRHAEAIKEFQGAIALKPKDGVLHNNLGAAYLAANRLKEAEASFKTALSISKDYPEALNNYGALLIKKRERKKAIEALTTATTLKNPYPEAHLNIAIAHELGRDYKAAVEHYSRFAETTTDEYKKDEAREKIKKLRYADLLNDARSE